MLIFFISSIAVVAVIALIAFGIYKLIVFEVGADECIGVRMRFGDIAYYKEAEKLLNTRTDTRDDKKPKSARVSGWIYLVPFIDRVILFPRKVLTFCMTTPTVVTARGYCSGYDEEVEPTIINITSTVQAQFDDNDEIVVIRDQTETGKPEHEREIIGIHYPRIYRTIQYAPGNDAVTLYEHVQKHVIDTVRAIGGRVPWRVVNQERYKFQLWILARMTCIDGGYYPLIGSGEKIDYFRFANIRLLPLGDKTPAPTEEDIRIGRDIRWSEDEVKNEAELQFPYDNTLKEKDKINADKEKTDIKRKKFVDMYKKGSSLTRENLIMSSPFMKFGLKRINLNIDDINFEDSDMDKAVSAPEKARLKKIADITTSEGTRQSIINLSEGKKTEIINLGEGEAHAREKVLKVISAYPEFEAMEALKEIGKGPSNWIFEMPKAISDALKNMAAGKHMNGDPVKVKPKEEGDISNEETKV